MPKLITEPEQDYWSNIQLIATDMDGTITQEGKFSSLGLAILERLAHQGIQVLITTGRSAGWVQGILHYLPIVGAIAENGGVYYPSAKLRNHPTNLASPQFLSPIAHLKTHRRNLETTFQHLRQKFPHLQESEDNLFRLTDWTFEVEGISLTELTELRTLCTAQGWGFTYSNVQCHIKPLGQDKAKGLRQILSQNFPELQSPHLVTIGDSINDESLFNPQEFPQSIGVANIDKYLAELKYQPQYITNYPEIAGFTELANLILNS